MTRLQKIALFLLVNAAGFFSPTLCYHLGVLSGAISPDGPDFNPALFLNGIIMTWAVCALFSFGFFFLKDRGRYFFLAAPLAIPVLYGLSAL